LSETQRGIRGSPGRGHGERVGHDGLWRAEPDADFNVVRVVLASVCVVAVW